MTDSPSKSTSPEIVVIIPAQNEAESITMVLADIPKHLISEVVVVDNDSSDNTAEKARKQGATVLFESKRGYGSACMKGIDYLLEKSTQPDIVVFLDGDYADYPEEMVDLIRPISEQGYDLVIGSRVAGRRSPGAMTPQQVFGNLLATTLVRLFFGVKFSDLGPFRAIRFNKLLELKLQEKTFGWTIEMQLKAIKLGMKICEVPVSYRARVGKSKISGTLRGTALAGYMIISTILKYR